jgi:hypothetical protein
MTNPTQPPTKRRGCLFYGGIVAAVLFILVLIVAYAGYRYVRNMVDQYTDTKPIDMPAVQMSDAQTKALQERLKNFDKSLEAGKQTEPLILTADEINALMAAINKTNPVPVHLFVSFNDNRVQAQLSIPTDVFGLKMLRGRYFNGSGDFRVSLHDGGLIVNAESLSVKGKPLPDQFMQSIRGQNFADSWTNDEGFQEALGKLQEIKIENGKLFVFPQTNAVDTTHTNAVEAPKPETGK